MMPSFRYVRAGSLDEAVRELEGAPRAYPHSGGTDLLGCLHDDVFHAEKVVSLSGLGDLHGIRETQDGGIEIGALTTITEIAESEPIRSRYAALADAAAVVASPQLRNQGTIGGNVCQKPRCWYYRGGFDCLRKGGDTCFALDGENQFHCVLGGGPCVIVHPSDPSAALVALDGVVRTQGPAGTRTIPVADLHVPATEDPTRETVLDQGEVVTAVMLPAPPQGLKSSYRKVRARQTWDFALGGIALALAFDGGTVREARAVLTGAAPVPWRSEPIEQAVRGQRLTEAVATRAGEAAMADAQPLEKNAYKLPLFRALVREQLLALR
jgi:xanthine dehydrogenase YagS FAD-binding subunit